LTAPIPSKLDERQILQGAYDEANGRLRTDSTSTILNADISVAIDSLTDSIAIKDSTGTKELFINTDGSINVSVDSHADSIAIKSSDGLRELTINEDGSLDVTDGLKSGGIYGAVTMSSANTAYEAKFGSTPLIKRKAVHVTLMSSGIFWGLDNSVTIANGTPTSLGQSLVFTADPTGGFTIFLVCATAGAKFRIVEIP
jgi:hypothetical protein